MGRCFDASKARLILFNPKILIQTGGLTAEGLGVGNAHRAAERMDGLTIPTLVSEFCIDCHCRAAPWLLDTRQ